jgi:hypothetical protein
MLVLFSDPYPKLWLTSLILIFTASVLERTLSLTLMKEPQLRYGFSNTSTSAILIYLLPFFTKSLTRASACSWVDIIPDEIAFLTSPYLWIIL